MTHEPMNDLDLLESAWGIIANANGGDWTLASQDWQDAAARFRDRYLARIASRSSSEGSTPEPWLVWSVDHNAWWGPKRGGYFPITGAGLYTETEAKAIASKSQPRAGSHLPHGAQSDRAMPLRDALANERAPRDSVLGYLTAASSPESEGEGTAAVHICGGSGKLTPESRAELEAFRYHLQHHKGQRLIAPCRFCEERKAKLLADAPSTTEKT